MREEPSMPQQRDSILKQLSETLQKCKQMSLTVYWKSINSSSELRTFECSINWAAAESVQNPAFAGLTYPEYWHSTAQVDDN